MNQDGEWENFPTDDELAEKAKHQELINALQVRIICHLCNEPPSVFQIKQRAMQNSWKCEKCSTINSSGRA